MLRLTLTNNQTLINEHVARVFCKLATFSTFARTEHNYIDLRIESELPS